MIDKRLEIIAASVESAGNCILDLSRVLSVISEGSDPEHLRDLLETVYDALATQQIALGNALKGIDDL
jgi:hypothetical protein